MLVSCDRPLVCPHVFLEIPVPPNHSKIYGEPTSPHLKLSFPFYPQKSLILLPAPTSALSAKGEGGTIALSLYPSTQPLCLPQPPRAMLEESVSSAPSIWAVVYSWFTPTVFFLLLQLMIGTIFITSTFANNNHRGQPDSNDDHRHPQQLARSPSVLQRLKSINFSSYRSQESPHHASEFHTSHEAPQPPLPRSPSMLQRLKSINLYNYFPTDPISSRFSPPDAIVLNAAHESADHFELPNAHEQEKHHLDDAPLVESDEEVEEDDVVGEIPHPEPERSIDEIYSDLRGVHVSRTKSDTKPASGEVPEKLPRKMKKSATTKSAFSHFRKEDIVENRRPATMREAKASVSEADDEVDAKADDFINKFKQQLQLQRLDSITRYKETIQKRSGQ